MYLVLTRCSSFRIQIDSTLFRLDTPYYLWCILHETNGTEGHQTRLRLGVAKPNLTQGWIFVGGKQHKSTRKCPSSILPSLHMSTGLESSKICPLTTIHSRGLSSSFLQSWLRLLRIALHILQPRKELTTVHSLEIMY